MHLDALLDVLITTAGPLDAGAPLITVARYVPPTSARPAADRNAARRMLAAFGHWMLAYGRIASGAPAGRRAALASLALPDTRPEQAVLALGDALARADIDAGWTPFATAFLEPGPGRLGDDYFRRFVEVPGARSLRDARPTPLQYAEFARHIESRAERFQQGIPGWDAPIALACAPQPLLWTGGSVAAWLERMSACHDLRNSPPLVYRARLAEYWSLVDAAPTLSSPEVAVALVGTHLWMDDVAIQQSVERALSQFPPLLALHGMLLHIVALESTTDAAVSLVDIFPEDLPGDVLTEMARAIDAAPVAARAAMVRVLQEAGESGSEHAERLLRELTARMRTAAERA